MTFDQEIQPGSPLERPELSEAPWRTAGGAGRLRGAGGSACGRVEASWEAEVTELLGPGEAKEDLKRRATRLAVGECSCTWMRRERRKGLAAGEILKLCSSLSWKRGHESTYPVINNFLKFMLASTVCSLLTWGLKHMLDFKSVLSSVKCTCKVKHIIKGFPNWGLRFPWIEEDKRQYQFYWALSVLQ